MRFILLVATVGLCASCGVSYTGLLADGGRGQVNCPNLMLKVPVTVLDKGGSPYPSAEVIVTYVGRDRTETITADGRGIASITDTYGPGVVRVQGKINDLLSDTKEITFIGSDCSEGVSPNAIQLQVK